MHEFGFQGDELLFLFEETPKLQLCPATPKKVQKYESKKAAAGGRPQGLKKASLAASIENERELCHRNDTYEKKSNMGGPRWALAPIVLTLCYQRCTHTHSYSPFGE